MGNKLHQTSYAQKTKQKKENDEEPLPGEHEVHPPNPWKNICGNKITVDVKNYMSTL